MSKQVVIPDGEPKPKRIRTLTQTIDLVTKVIDDFNYRDRRRILKFVLESVDFLDPEATAAALIPQCNATPLTPR